jgi:hypothetical protein
MPASIPAYTRRDMPADLNSDCDQVGNPAYLKPNTMFRHLPTQNIAHFVEDYHFLA